jgi:PAS domain S-box-containing protein
MIEKPTYEELEQRVRELEKAEYDFSEERDRAEHLRNILIAIRNVNKLIVRETDPKALVNKVCSELTKTRGYFNTWIALLDEEETYVSVTASSSFNGGFHAMKSNLQRGVFPSCISQTLADGKLIVAKNPLVDCPNCPLSSEYGDRAGMSCTLSYRGKTYGVLSVSSPRAYADDNEEHDLFAELAADLAFALSKLKTDAQVHHLNQIVTSIPQPISFVSRDYRYHAVNDVYAELFGIAAQKIIGQTPADFFDKQVFETEIKPRLDHVLNGNNLQYEIQADFPGRGKRWMFMSYYPYRNETGDIAGVISHGHDITDRKLAEEALRKSEERFSLAMDASKDGLWDWDLTTGDIYCSPGLLSMLGYDSTDVIENVDKWRDLIHPEDRQKTYQVNIDCVNNVTDSFQIEYRMKTNDGGWKWILGRGRAVYRDGFGRALRMIGTHQDITERKHMEEALRESEEKYRILFEHTGEALFVAQDGRIVFQNPRSNELSAYSAEEFQSKPFFDFIHEDDREMVMDHHIRRLNGEKIPERYVFRIIHKNSNILWAELNAVLIQWKGKPAVLCFMTDITERKKEEEERESLIADLQNALSKIKTLSGLLPICSYCKKIRDDKGYWQEVEAYIRKYSEAKFSHSICQECAKKHYPDFDIYED